MNKLIVKNAVLDGSLTDISIAAGVIEAIGPAEAGPDTEVLDASGMAVLPSFYNGHSHAGMAALRGMADDMELIPWLETKIWPAEAKLDPEDIYWSTRFACQEMIRYGITFFSDMYWHRDVVVRAVRDSGMSARLPVPALDAGNPDQEKRDRRNIEKQFEASHDDPAGIQFAVSPHAIYTVSESQLKWISGFAEKHNLPLHIHLSETEGEVTDCLRQHGRRPLHYLNDLGLLNSDITLAHAVWVDEDELELMARKRVSAVANPVSNAKLVVGRLFPYSEYRKRQIPVCIGTDSVASNNALNILNDVKYLSLMTKLQQNDATVLPAEECFSLLTDSAAQIFGTGGGRIAVGRDADLLLVDLNHFSLLPGHSLLSDMIYGDGGRAIRSVISRGRLVMKDGRIPEEVEVADHLRHIAGKLNG